MIDISFGLFETEQTAFNLGQPSRNTKYSLWEDGSCNCDEIHFIPHAHCTHTETAHHIQTNLPFSSVNVIQAIPFQQKCILIDKNLNITDDGEVTAVIIKFGISPPYSEEPPYLREDDMRRLMAAYPKAQHILCDLPSLDRRDDTRLTCHRIFFQKNPRGTITEMCNLSTVQAGFYKLYLAPVMIHGSDAHPSRPLLCPFN